MTACNNKHIERNASVISATKFNLIVAFTVDVCQWTFIKSYRISVSLVCAHFRCVRSIFPLWWMPNARANNRAHTQFLISGIIWYSHYEILPHSSYLAISERIREWIEIWKENETSASERDRERELKQRTTTTATTTTTVSRVLHQNSKQSIEKEDVVCGERETRRKQTIFVHMCGLFTVDCYYFRCVVVTHFDFIYRTRARRCQCYSTLYAATKWVVTTRTRTPNNNNKIHSVACTKRWNWPAFPPANHTPYGSK